MIELTETFTSENTAFVLVDHQVRTMQLINNLDLSLCSTRDQGGFVCWYLCRTKNLRNY